jgi:hypothetical protein
MHSDIPGPLSPLISQTEDIITDLELAIPVPAVGGGGGGGYFSASICPIQNAKTLGWKTGRLALIREHATM